MNVPPLLDSLVQSSQLSEKRMEACGLVSFDRSEWTELFGVGPSLKPDVPRVRKKHAMTSELLSQDWCTIRFAGSDALP